MTGTEHAIPIMIQPMWVTILVQLFTLGLAGGISYGMTRAKLSSNEKEIAACRAKTVEIEKDLAVWQRHRLATVKTNADCDKLQHLCKDELCKKLDDMSGKLDAYIKTANLTGQSLAMIIGAICQKLDIPRPELK